MVERHKGQGKRMKFSVVNAEQRSIEWRSARVGRVTGSRAADVVATIKSGEAAARRDYRLQLAVERLTGQPMESGFVNAEMQHGIDMEPAARAKYEAKTGLMVRQTGFLASDELLAGCSLDGDVDEFTGLVEIKCPKSTTHIGYLQGGQCPSGYLPQITHNLWVSGAHWCDFASFDDRLPAGLDWFCVRVHRAELDIDSYAMAVQRFLAEVEETTAALMRLRAA
jgi:hypothetical protein